MIGLLRKLRHQLLNEHKFSKYLIYASGEILLVMIGILLALQVNDWNSHRLEGHKEQRFLKNLKADFKTNLTELNKNYKNIEGAYQASMTLLEVIKDNSAINPTQVDTLLDAIINISFNLDLNTTSINEISNTGSLNIISDPKLRKHISDWPVIVSDTKDDADILFDYFFTHFIPSLTKRVQMRNWQIPEQMVARTNLPQVTKSGLSVDYEKTIRNLEFENQVYNNALNFMYTLDAYKNFEAYLTDTLQLIEEEIE